MPRSRINTVSIATFLSTFVHFNSVNYFMQAAQRTDKNVLLNSPCHHYQSTLAWPSACVGHFPIGYKFNALYGRLIKKYDDHIHPGKKIDPVRPFRCLTRFVQLYPELSACFFLWFLYLVCLS